MPELETTVTEKEMARIKAVADRMGMTVDELVTHAANAELRLRYLLPKLAGQLLQLPMRTKEGA